MKTYKITSKSQNVYQIERADKQSFHLRYLVSAENDAKAAEICKALSEDTKAAIAKYDIDVCMK